MARGGGFGSSGALAMGPRLPGQQQPSRRRSKEQPKEQQPQPQREREWGLQRETRRGSKSTPQHAVAASSSSPPPEDAAAVATAALRSRVLELALEPQGSREVQRALEEARGAEQELIVRELQGHVAKALQSPHANHVLQKAISVMWPSDMFFIIPELLQWGCPSAIAKHPYGCRVLERLMEFFPSEWLTVFITDLLDNIGDLSKHPYGNFVVQHLFEHGTAEQRKHIVRLLCSDLYALSLNQNACGVVDKALTYAAWEDQLELVERMLAHRALLVTMASKRWGFSTAERLLSVARGPSLDEAHRQLMEGMMSLQRTASGRQLLELAVKHRPTSAELGVGGATSGPVKSAKLEDLLLGPSTKSGMNCFGNNGGLHEPKVHRSNGLVQLVRVLD